MNELIKTFALDTENDYNNINLARYYHSIGHTASAITHYLRCAEITQDQLLAYECLLLMSLSFMEQGNRDFTAQLILKQAIVVLPERSEAYLLLCKFLLEKHEYYDCYLFSCIALKMYENNIPLKFHRIDDIYPKLLYFKAHSGIHWEKTQESKDIFQELYINYFDVFNIDMQKIILDNIDQNILTKKTIINNTTISNWKIVDFFPYFSETGKELLELRINLLKDYVDEFIICESNKTQSGRPIEYTLQDTIKELGLPQDKIKIINLNIPEEINLDIQEIDIMNCTENYMVNGTTNINSLRARVLDRMQKDSILQVLEDYDENTIFIHSDSDEMINPQNLSFIIDIVKNNLDNVISIPLIHLEGRADMRVVDKDSGQPAPWFGMFFATKNHLKINTPCQIRSHVFVTLPIVYLTQNDKYMEDLGWHFSWMGDADKRKIKVEAFTHHNDKLSFLEFNGYDSPEMQEFHKTMSITEGSKPPSGNTKCILKKIDHKLLPKEIFELPNVKKYLLPE
jgi:hypothetical protein